MDVEASASGSAIDIDALKGLAANIRRWAPVVLREAERNDDEGAERLSLEKSVKYLDGVVHAAQERNTTNRSGGFVYKAEFVVKALLLSRMLRSKNKVRDVEERVWSMLPKPLAPLVRKLQADGFLKMCSPTTIRRSQLVVDACLCMHRRIYLAPVSGSRYLFADSSPQGNYDWFVVNLVEQKNNFPFVHRFVLACYGPLKTIRFQTVFFVCTVFLSFLCTFFYRFHYSFLDRSFVVNHFFDVPFTIFVRLRPWGSLGDGCGPNLPFSNRFQTVFKAISNGFFVQLRL